MTGKLTVYNYVEIAWVAVSLYLGSLIYERTIEGNMFLNLACIFAVASPLLVARACKAANLNVKGYLIVVAICIACSIAWAAGLNADYSGQQFMFIPFLCLGYFLVVAFLRFQPKKADANTPRP